MDEVMSKDDMKKASKMLEWMFIEDLYNDALLYSNKVINNMLKKINGMERLTRVDMDNVTELMSQIPPDMTKAISEKLEQSMVNIFKMDIIYFLRLKKEHYLKKI